MIFSPHQVAARDDDSVENSRLTYSIRRGDKNLFEIGETSGLITTKQPLDREKRDRYELTIVAYDSGKWRHLDSIII